MSQGTTAQFRCALSGNPIPLPHVRELLVGSGCELAQAFCRLGSRVIIAQDAPLFLPNVERDASRRYSARHSYLSDASRGHQEGCGRL